MSFKTPAPSGRDQGRYPGLGRKQSGTGKEGAALMERYEAYKDSGVEWLGEIPVGWEVVKTILWFSTNWEWCYSNCGGAKILLQGEIALDCYRRFERQ